MTSRILLFLLFALSISNFVYSTANGSNSGPIVNTVSGKIRGFYRESYHGRKFKAFEGIPYAKPPIGELRFELPVPISPWSNILNATSAPTACKQYNGLNFELIGEEDCLYMNIYVPETNKSSSLPVLFWIHGGGFQYGTSINYGPKYLMDRNLILITINYRLGVLGFLNTNDDVMPGNVGLKDQNLALRWVRQNIRYFGGDSRRITLAGVSAGGSSVHYHYLSPMSRGLFRNGISFSGTATDTFAHADNTLNTTKKLAKLVDCPIDNSRNIVNCLKEISIEKIFDAILSMLDGLPFSYAAFPPVSERINSGYFINKSPIEILESGEVYDAPWIAGVVEEDGLFMTAGFALKEDVVDYVDKNWTTLAPYAVHYKYLVPENEQSQISNLLRKHYFGIRTFSTSKEGINDLTRMIGDGLIVLGAVKAAKIQSKVNKNPVWFYYYTYRANQSFSDHLSNTSKNLGVSHDDDIYLVLENKYIDPTRTKCDRTMLQNMLDFWYSYVSTGKPNLGVEWPSLGNDSDFRYMHIAGPSNYRMEIDNNFRDYDFWTSLGL